MSSKMIALMLLSSFLATAITAPSQMLQAIMKQQMFQPSQEIDQQFSLLQQLQRIQQEMTMQAEMQMQQQIPLLQPLQGTVQQQRLAMQEQMFALQQFQALQRMNLVPSTSINPQPILVLFPNNEPDMQQTGIQTNSLRYTKPEEMGDEDSEVIDAEPTEELNYKRNSMKAVLLMPNTRGIFGDLISYIPFLPIEINVPDLISWMYNGIAGIISGIGQRLPFRPLEPNGGTNVKSIWNQIKKNQQMPIVVIPLGNQLM